MGSTIYVLEEGAGYKSAQPGVAVLLMVGANASKISLIETSTRNVTLSTLARVAQALNTRIKIEFVPVKAKKRR
jgi:transcriptional regulator with XRE-family HTH domain